jgi:hypothetical protein
VNSRPIPLFAPVMRTVDMGGSPVNRCREKGDTPGFNVSWC